jgi:hypothetical protein
MAAPTVAAPIIVVNCSLREILVIIGSVIYLDRSIECLRLLLSVTNGYEFVIQKETPELRPKIFGF